MLYFLLVISTLISSGKAVIFKKIGVESKYINQLLALNSLSFAVASVTVFAISGFNFNSIIRISPYSAVMSAVLAFFVTITYLSQIKALSYGNTSATVLIYSCGFLIPIIFGTLVYNEKITFGDIFAVALLLISLFLIITPENNTAFSLKWLLFSGVSMAGSGCIAVLQKIHQHSQFANEFISLSVLEFIFAAVILTIITYIVPNPRKRLIVSLKDVSAGALNGLFIGVLNLLNLTLAGKLPAMILFPIYNIGSIVLTGFLCTLIYKEKNTKKEAIGFAIGCIAIIIIGIF